ncbi:R3H domain-containing protein 1 [Ananas comosus]|uniref:R3H domain-containing protein 1 n=1 Tax=Ananas comosus TaxID=4615 RepID=A0A199UQR4_ANACO|nr:R3H domain-containing protein 1 [Ananas comosus]
MGSMETPIPYAPAHDNGSEEVEVEEKGEETEMGLNPVDPFLVEALENPRHRLTVLRMELDIQKFMQNPNLQEFEFQHFPTSYLRCAAHRIAQHYGLETTVADSILDCSSSRIIARKTSVSKIRSISLSEIPCKVNDTETREKFRIAIRQRPNKVSQSDANVLETKKNLLKTVEERKEEYDKARARIFSGTSVTDPEIPLPSATAVGRNLSLEREESVNFRPLVEEHDKITINDGPSRIAIFRDREKDRNDPDYDRSYGRYFQGLAPNPNFYIGAFGALHPPLLQYDGSFLQFGNFPGNQTSFNCGMADSTMNALPAVGYQQSFSGAAYQQWPASTMMYTNCYYHPRQAIVQVPSYQSFDHSHNS